MEDHAGHRAPGPAAADTAAAAARPEGVGRHCGAGSPTTGCAWPDPYGMSHEDRRARLRVGR